MNLFCERRPPDTRTQRCNLKQNYFNYKFVNKSPLCQASDACDELTTAANEDGCLFNNINRVFISFGCRFHYRQRHYLNFIHKLHTYHRVECEIWFLFGLDFWVFQFSFVLSHMWCAHVERVERMPKSRRQCIRSVVTPQMKGEYRHRRRRHHCRYGNFAPDLVRGACVRAH